MGLLPWKAASFQSESGHLIGEQITVVIEVYPPDEFVTLMASAGCIYDTSLRIVVRGTRRVQKQDS
jgi:hypothetical protein